MPVGVLVLGANAAVAFGAVADSPLLDEWPVGSGECLGGGEDSGVERGCCGGRRDTAGASVAELAAVVAEHGEHALLQLVLRLAEFDALAQ